MAIRWVSSAWKTALTQFPQDHRVYLDFRQQLYPDIGGAPTFTLVAEADNRPGSHNLTGGYANYLLDMPSTMTLDFYFKPTFSYTGGTDQYLWSWYIDATHQLSFYYDVAAHKYTLAWEDGTAMRTMLSSAYASDVSFQVWTRASFSLDLTTGTAAGSTFYLDGVSISTAWSGVGDVKTRFFPTFTIRGRNGTAGGYTINYARMFSVTSTDAQVSSNFWNVSTDTKKDEEVVWHFNGHSVGHTRCNVTARVNNLQFSRSTESAAGNSNANTASVVLMSPEGQFADDQYSAFAPASEIYNGTSSQKYMQTHCPIEIETWYGGLFELEFCGHIDDSLFQRKSTIGDISMVTISAQDTAEWLQKSLAQRGYAFENYDLSNPASASTSLIHSIARINTQKSWYNYVANSGFENPTAANSWTVAGGGATLTRTAGGLQGSWQGDFTCTTAGTITQTIPFNTLKKLDAGQNWNLSGYVKSATAGNFMLSLIEQGAGSTAISTNTVTAAMAASGGWQKIEKTVTISTSTAAQLQIRGAVTGLTVSIDSIMLVQNNRSLNWAFATTNDGASGIMSADSAQSSTYDTIGFDVDDAPITHPWAVVAMNTTPWSYLNDIHDGTAAYYLGFDACGTLKYRTPLKAGYADPTSLITISDVQSVDSIIDAMQANHIVINGVQTVKGTNYTVVWDAYKSGSFATLGGSLYEAINAGADWPSIATYPEYWATYSESN